MVLKTVSAANEVPGYAQLQRQVRDALWAQHPEWVQLNGDSPKCDAYEWRFAELLRILARDSMTINAPRFANFATQLQSTAENIPQIKLKQNVLPIAP